MKYPFLFILFFSFLSTSSQETKNSVYNIKKIGFLYNNANDKNFLFDDKDFSYSTNTYKLQFFYDLGKWRSLNFELTVQPQIQFLKHQLNNEYFILPTEENFEQKIKEFTTPKNMNLYALEIGFIMKKEVLKKLDILTTIGLGIATIDTRTERLAKGFTFIENFSLGLSYESFRNTFVYIGTNLGHVSNLNFKQPNGGYNLLGLEIGISYSIK